MKKYLMHKDDPVLEIDGTSLKILNFHKLPYALRYEDVNYEDVMHMWCPTRSMNIGKTNGKKIVNALKFRQTNPYLLAKACHFATLSDCYWMQDEGENLRWKDVSFFQVDYDRNVQNIALFGAAGIVIENPSTIRTPEIVSHGLSAKAWMRKDGELYLYKIGKKEIAASMILDALGVEHVPYSACSAREIPSIADEPHLQKILEAGELVVKSRCITSEEMEIISWEDFEVYCERNGELDPYGYVSERFPRFYNTMVVVDYLLGNDDRHGENWGFFVDSSTCEIICPYPLMDHDHAFSNEELVCQTYPSSVLMKDVVPECIGNCRLDFSTLGSVREPLKELIGADSANAFFERAKGVEELCKQAGKE